MNNNTDFTGQGFAWTLENLKTENEISFDQPQPYSLTEADLYQLLLGDEQQQQQQQMQVQQQQQQHQPLQQQCQSFYQPPNIALGGSTCGDSSSASEDMMIQEKTNRKTKKTKSNENKPPASSTGRLDFRPINDCIPESQLKAMTSKERRQLRNKISARNFRNRRKEYLGNLEEELNQQKAENSQLKLEIKWLKSNMEKVQKENDRLRIELMLSSNNNTSLVETSPPMIESSPASDIINTELNSSSLINSTMNSSSFTNSSDESNSLPSPPNLLANFPDNWDFILPSDTFLSHALVPSWNFNHVLSKETSAVVQSPNLLQQYPLLAPALMSIVLQHTMTMSTDDLLATAKLSPPTVASCIPYDKKYYFSNSNMMSQKEARAVWDMLEPLRHMNERNERISLSTKNKTKKLNTMVLVRHNEAVEEEFCPMTWLRDSALRYLCEFVATVTSDRQDIPQPLNVTQSAQAPPPAEDPLKKKFILCRKYQEAVRYITASS